MVYVLLGNGFEETEAIAPVDILRRGGLEVAYVGVSGKTADGMHGVRLEADLALDEVALDDMEMLVLPGGATNEKGNYGSSPAAQALIKKAFAMGKTVAAICAAPVVLSRLGLLSGRRCTCYPGLEGMLDGAAHVKEAKVVRDGSLVTGQGPGAALDFGFNLLALLRGVSAAEAVRGQMFYPQIPYAV